MFKQMLTMLSNYFKAKNIPIVPAIQDIIEKLPNEVLDLNNPKYLI